MALNRAENRRRSVSPLSLIGAGLDAAFDDEFLTFHKPLAAVGPGNVGDYLEGRARLLKMRKRLFAKIGLDVGCQPEI